VDNEIFTCENAEADSTTVKAVRVKNFIHVKVFKGIE
jgi:hypothetical protein